MNRRIVVRGHRLEAVTDATNERGRAVVHWTCQCGHTEEVLRRDRVRYAHNKHKESVRSAPPVDLMAALRESLERSIPTPDDELEPVTATDEYRALYGPDEWRA